MNKNQQNFEHWHLALRNACGRFEAKAPSHLGLFLGHVLKQDLGGLEISSIRTNAPQIVCHTVRNSTKTDCTDDRHCYLVVQQSGHSRLSQAHMTVDLAPGDMAFMDAAYGCEITPQGLMEHMSIHLDRHKVEKLLPTGMTRLAKLSRASTSGKLIHMLASQICDGRGEQSSGADEGEALQHAMVTLLGQALKQPSHAEKSVQPDGLDRHMLAHAKKLIDSSLKDPQLTPARLAQQLGMSVRQLYRLFEQADESVCRYIHRARLHAAAKDLGNPFMHDKSLTVIAYAWGFSDSAHFSRSFKKQFDLTPRDYRQQMHQTGSACPH